MKPAENLTHFIKSHSESNIEKGFGLFEEYEYEIIILNKKRKQYEIEVPSESGNGSYIVLLNVLADSVQDNCECKAFEKYGQCKHVIAAALTLMKEEFDFGFDELEELVIADSMEDELNLINAKTALQQNDNINKNTKIIPLHNAERVSHEWKKITLKGSLQSYLLSDQSGYYSASYSDFAKLTQTGFDRQTLHWRFSFNEKKNLQYVPEIKYDSHQTFLYRCDCDHRGRYPMCKHVHITFDKLLHDHGPDYFLQFRDWTEEKNKLLQPYGLSAADEESKAFQFSVSYVGELQMHAPSSYIREGDKDQLKKLNKILKPKIAGAAELLPRPATLANTIIDFETGFVFNMNSQRLKIGFELEPAKVYVKPDRTDLRKLSLNQPANLPLLKELNDEFYSFLLQLSDNNLLDYLETHGQGSMRNCSNPWNYLYEGSIKALKNYYIECLQKLWSLLAQNTHTFLLRQGKFSNNNCKPVKISNENVELLFRVKADERFITIALTPMIGKMPVTAGSFELLHSCIFNIENTLHIVKNIHDIPVLGQFADGFIKVPVSSKYEVIKNIISPLQERYVVELPNGFEIQTVCVEPHSQVLLKEFNDQYLMLQPQFVYEGCEVDYSSNPEDILTTLPDGSLQMTKRDVTKEKQFYESLRSLHNDFGRQRQNDFFYVHFNEVMKGHWFLNTVRYLQENNITVKGMHELKRFRYNTHKPKWEMKAGSGIDWFDLRVKVSFGDQTVPLKEVRKAILNRQSIVVLGDGTFGVLPEEWLHQFGLLLKMGDEQKDGTLRLSKMHFTIIDELHKEINDEAILGEIEVKKQKLKNIENINTVNISKTINAELRPYQQSGFQWLQTLDELGWGACLADDMGLGKTLQTISFLQCMKEKYANSTHLVVCPTSLIYNWENELKKFAPSLSYHIYYGSGREFTDEHFENYDIIITSYGLVRNDMEQLLRFQWHYVILDESQAIKNPEAQTTKAVQLLKAKNRLILSGTPVQNNTFDLYAQFHFLNPGLLGNKEFYKSEFATPIDKYNDAEKSRQLRRLVYPFLLRRTKEQVAKDLPDKTETVLWCQLQKDQRSVYEDYKNYYRAMLMKKIAEEGMAKAGMYVLEGLLRLRQICDSPQLLKDAEVTTTQSVKLEELLREIEENTGSHKLLVFSQFTEMLQLIQDALKHKKISYCYLDGSTPAEKRKQQVEIFQTDESIKVFLISLKAGGVGLNLTAADYIYIVDPWWNPAVEQQAIDRTHRIGQTKKIFAYKMICKDTVEEKILQLQQRKKQIANELVTEDAGFIKKLTKEDVEFLFA